MLFATRRLTSRIPRVWRQLRAIAVLPGLGVVGIPATILIATGAVEIGWGLPAASRWLPSLVGAVLVAAGLVLMYRTIGLFARIGDGTLAPWDPARRLVVQGPYRHVRNPMISGVLAVLLGEAVCSARRRWRPGSPSSWPSTRSGSRSWKSRGCAAASGGEYETYARAVPRWIPRRTPWQPPTA